MSDRTSVPCTVKGRDGAVCGWQTPGNEVGIAWTFLIFVCYPGSTWGPGRVARVIQVTLVQVCERHMAPILLHTHKPVVPRSLLRASREKEDKGLGRNQGPSPSALGPSDKRWREYVIEQSLRPRVAGLTHLQPTRAELQPWHFWPRNIAAARV